MIAPLQLSVQRIGLTYDEPDAPQILRAMHDVIETRQREPYLSEFSRRMLKGVRDNDQNAQAKRLLDFVRAKMIYTADPLGSEQITDPVNLLLDIQQRGEARGDCDDHVVLLASLLGSIGIPAEPLAVKYKGSRYNHVIVRAKLGGEWVEMDPCSKSGPQPVYRDMLTVEQAINSRPMNANASYTENVAAFAFGWADILTVIQTGSQAAGTIIGAINQPDQIAQYQNVPSFLQPSQQPAADPMAAYKPLLYGGVAVLGTLALVMLLKK